MLNDHLIVEDVAARFAVVTAIAAATSEPLLGLAGRCHVPRDIARCYGPFVQSYPVDRVCTCMYW